MIASRGEILAYLGKTASITDADLALLTMLHAPAESALATYLQTNFEYQQHVELLPVSISDTAEPSPLNEDFETNGTIVTPRVRGSGGSSRLQLKNLPVLLAGMEVREDVDANAGQASNAFPGSSILVAGDDWWLDCDEVGLSNTGVVHRNGFWPTEDRCVKVTYYAGKTAAQLRSQWGVVLLAAIKTVASEFWKAKARQSSGGAGSKRSENIGKYGYSIGGDGSSILAAPMTVPAEAMNDLESLRVYRYF